MYCISLLVNYDVDLCVFFKQKTAYEMRISDWSSDVCSSDLAGEIVGSHVFDVVAELGEDGAEDVRVDVDAGPVEQRDLDRVGRFQIGRASCRERVCQYV